MIFEKNKKPTKLTLYKIILQNYKFTKLYRKKSKGNLFKEKIRKRKKRKKTLKY
jgi:hypothetical protein